jgi:putative ABC transport system permease protein
MLRNYLTITIRSLSKKKLFVFINILGMGLAVALCIVAYLNWEFRSDWDSDQQKIDKIYRIQFKHELGDQQDNYAISPTALAINIKENSKEVKAVSRYVSTYINLRIKEEVFTPSVIYTDSSFFEIFDLELKQGSIKGLTGKSRILISDELANKYFKREDVVGEQIIQINEGAQQELEIVGVFSKRPRNTSFRFDALSLWENQDDAISKDENWKEWCSTFALIEDPAKVEIVTAQLNNYVEIQNTARPDLKVMSFYLEPFKGLQDIRDVRGNELWGGAPKAVVTIPSIMAVLLLLLACFNFTNTSIALSSQRLKEISIRKVMGGVRKQLIIQFLGENLLLCALAFIVGLLLAEIVVPAYSNLWWWLELDLNYTENAGILIFILVLLIVTGVLAGSYPAFYITSFEPISILKGKAKFGGTNWLTRTLLAAQFSISLVTIIFAVGFFRNAQYQENFDLGFRKSDVISIWIEQSANKTFRDALENNDDIVQVAGTKDHISNSIYSESIRYESVEKQVDILDVGDDYFNVMNIEIETGRGFNKDSETDRNESIIVSEEFVNRLGWKDNPIGKRIIWRDSIQLYVIGTTKNIYSRTMFNPVEPVMIRYVAPDEYNQVVVRTAPGKHTAANDFMKQTWKSILPNISYEPQFIERQMEITRDTNRNVIVVFGFIGFFAGLMSFTGLLTLVSLTIMKRIKEIGIRKVLGASVRSIVKEISFDFMLVLIIASMLGGFVGYIMVDVSMDAAWEYYESVNVATIIISISILILLAILIAGFKIVNAAKMNPVKNLRTE